MISLSVIKIKTLQYINKFYIIIAVILVIAILMASYFTFFKKEYAHIKSLGVTDYQQRLNERDTKKSQLAQLEKVFENYQKVSKDEIKKLSVILPSEKDTSSLMIEMQAMVSESGLTLDSIDMSQGGVVSLAAGTAGSSPALNIQKISVNLKVSGIDSYNKLKLFLNNIEKNIRILDLNALTYSPETMQYGINLVTYYQGQ